MTRDEILAGNEAKVEGGGGGGAEGKEGKNGEPGGEVAAEEDRVYLGVSGDGGGGREGGSEERVEYGSWRSLRLGT